MPLFYRLFFREFIGLFLLSWALFSGLIWLFLFLQTISLFLSSPLSLLQYFLIELKTLPEWIDLTLPLAWLFALCVAISKLRQNQEWLGIWGAGVSSARIRLPYLIMAFFLGGGSLLWQEFISFPFSAKRAQERVELLGQAPERRELILTNLEDRTILWTANFNQLRNTIEQPFFFLFDRKGNLAWSIEGVTAFLSEEKTWIFREARVWSYRGGRPSLARYPLLEVEDFRQSPASLALARGDWALSTLGELLETYQLIKEEKKRPPNALEAEIYSRLIFPLDFIIMALWAFWVSFKWPSTNLLFALMSSLSFDIIYTILHLVLVHFSALGFFSAFVAGALELSFWSFLLWILYYRFYR